MVRMFWWKLGRPFSKIRDLLTLAHIFRRGGASIGSPSFDMWWSPIRVSIFLGRVLAPAKNHGWGWIWGPLDGIGRTSSFLMIMPTSWKFLQPQYSYIDDLLHSPKMWRLKFTFDSWYDGCNVWMQSRCWVYFRSWIQTHLKSPSRIDWSLTNPHKKKTSQMLPPH